MRQGIIDSCSLINLATGWRGLEELGSLDCQWHVCDAVLKESEFTREYDVNGVPELVPLDVNRWTQQGLLRHIYPEAEHEIQDYVEFACEVDDGEAQALALAKNRGLVLLTDDRKALSLAERNGIQTLSTAAVLVAWAALAPRHQARLREILTRIEVLARFRPPCGSVEYAWWCDNC